MRRILSTLTSISLVVTAGGTVALAQEGEAPPPTEVHSVETSADGAAVAVAAHIDFGGQAPVVLGTDPTGDAPPNGTGHGSAFGLDLTEVRAFRADPADPVVTFEWQTTGIDQLPPPELMRYYWQFEIDGLGFAAQAKTSDVVSAANLGDGEPGTIADNLTSYSESGVPSFRVRGNCGLIEVGPTGLNNCGHVAWIDGEFDFDADVVRLQLPLDLENAESLRPGATLLPVADGTYSAIQAAADLPQTRDTLAVFENYVVPDSAADARLLDADGIAVGTASLEAGEDGMWHGTVTAPEPGTYTVEVTGCFADNCGSAPASVVVE